MIALFPPSSKIFFPVQQESITLENTHGINVVNCVIIVLLFLFPKVYILPLSTLVNLKLEEFTRNE